MTDIKFGTDGWRAIIAKDFTTANVARAAEGTARWLLSKGKNSIVIGYDFRFGGQLFAEAAAMVMAHHDIKVYLSAGFASTPMVSLGTVHFKAGAGVIITASHNPPAYNGFKLKGHYGGPMLAGDIKDVEKMIPGIVEYDFENVNIDKLVRTGKIEIVNLEDIYCSRVTEYFDLKSIKKSKLNFAYDAMYGAGQNVIRRILPGTTLLHCINNPSFQNTPPEPLMKNLGEFSRMIKRDGNIACGLATDGDADRIGLMDDRGNFVDSHHIILLLVHYLCKYKLSPPEKQFCSKVVTGFSTTVKLKKLCDYYSLQLEVVPIGFKYICEIMINEKDAVLLGGEESGGIAVKGHIPERDGIWVGLTLWEFMTKSGKSLRELIKEVYKITGPFAFERNDLPITDAQKIKITERCKAGAYSSFGKFNVQRVEDTDGYKFFFNDDEWLMIRASGTEPLLRTYAEAADKAKVQEILEACANTII